MNKVENAFIAKVKINKMMLTMIAVSIAAWLYLKIILKINAEKLAFLLKPFGSLLFFVLL